MKTVRTGVFYLNSSSTHSITIKHIKLDTRTNNQIF